MDAHKNNNPKPQTGGWTPRGSLPHPNAMDTSAGRTRGRLAGSEEINFHAPPNPSRGGFLPHRRGGGHPQQDLREVECYICHKKGHFSCNCSQHMWNQSRSQG